MSVSTRGALVLSLDFELHWGVRDHTDVTAPALRGAREAVARLLDVFTARGVACTWATVGLLFAPTREEQRAASPAARPDYLKPALDAYSQTVGGDEAEDPVHFAPSLIAEIAAAPRQELATHTFSHYYCGEPGATPETFRADLLAAQAIADRPLRSIVFPRNQSGPDYVAVLPEVGIDVFRGNPAGWIWRAEEGAAGRHWARRIGRLFDTYVPVAKQGSVPWASILRPDGLADVRASRFLRPHDPRLVVLEPLRLRRITKGMEGAAQRGHVYHLWWHPHNFGIHLEENLRVLGQVLDAWERLRDEYRLESLTMAEAADRARELHGCSCVVSPANA